MKGEPTVKTRHVTLAALALTTSQGCYEADRFAVYTR